MSRADLMKNALVTIGDWKVANYNIPKYSDVILQLLPSVIDFEGSGYSLTFQANCVDFGTGSIQEFLLYPAMSISGELTIASFNRQHLNKTVDFSFLVEGRYLSFWSSFLIPVFQAVINGPAVFPNMGDLERLFGLDTTTGKYRKTFYSLNWGQEKYWNSATRILAIYTEGYRKCFWTQVESCKTWIDPRLVEVTIRHDLPEIMMSDIDVITEYVYMRVNSDEIEFNFITSEIAQTPLSFVEDLNGIYDPWTEIPPNYPEID